MTQEVVRVMLNCSEDLVDDIRVEHLNKLSVKLRTSGYNTQFIRKVLVAGLKNYEKKVKNSKLDVSDKNYAPLHIPRGFKSARRLEKKLMTKSSWYKKDGKMCLKDKLIYCWNCWNSFHWIR